MRPEADRPEEQGHPEGRTGGGRTLEQAGGPVGLSGHPAGTVETVPFQRAYDAPNGRNGDVGGLQGQAVDVVEMPLVPEEGPQVHGLGRGSAEVPVEAEGRDAPTVAAPVPMAMAHRAEADGVGAVGAEIGDGAKEAGPEGNGGQAAKEPTAGATPFLVAHARDNSMRALRVTDRWQFFLHLRDTSSFSSRRREPFRQWPAFRIATGNFPLPPAPCICPGLALPPAVPRQFLHIIPAKLDAFRVLRTRGPMPAGVASWPSPRPPTCSPT